MTVICHCRGGFGNHMLVYMLGCILGNKMNKSVVVITNSITNDKLNQRNDTRTAILKIIIKNPTYTNSNNSIVVNDPKHYFKILDDYNSYFDKDIHLKLIHAENMAFYANNINIILPYINDLSINDDFSKTLTISFRLGMGRSEESPQIFSQIHRLKEQYYIDSIKYMFENYDIDKIIVCSDNYVDKYIDRVLNGVNCEIVKLENYDTISQFKIIVNSNYFISSNSTFSIVATLFQNPDTTISIFPQYKSSNSIHNGEKYKGHNIKMYPKMKHNIYTMID